MGADALPEPAAGPGMAWLPLTIALLILVVMTVLPGIATDAAGHADHTAAMLLFWSMSAGFVRGVGFVPLHWLPRWLLSATACVAALTLAVIRLDSIGHSFLPI